MIDPIFELKQIARACGNRMIEARILMWIADHVREYQVSVLEDLADDKAYAKHLEDRTLAKLVAAVVQECSVVSREELDNGVMLRRRVALLVSDRRER